MIATNVLFRRSTDNGINFGSTVPLINKRIEGATPVAPFILPRTLPCGGEVAAVLENKQRVAVWLFDAWARTVLGAPGSESPSRWVAMGNVVEVAQQGIWMTTERIEEWKPDGERVAWKFTQRTLLIRWEAVITVQVVDGDERDIGFKADR